MKHGLAIAVVLAGCAKGRGGQAPSHPVSYGSSSGTHVYRTSVTGTAMGGPPESDRGAPQTSGGGKRLNDTLIAGLIVLGTSYAITVATAQTIQATLFTDFDRMIGAEDSVSKLWFPVFGAWSGIIFNETTVRDNCNAANSLPFGGGNCDLVTAGTLGMAVGAIAQTTGLVLTLYGALKPPPFRAPVHSGRFAIVPHGSRGGAGVTVSGSF